jgi:pentatricopeptide repeat protein
MKKTTKPPTKMVALRLTEEARELFDEMARRQGLTRTSALEGLIRNQAECKRIRPLLSEQP